MSIKYIVNVTILNLLVKPLQRLPGAGLPSNQWHVTVSAQNPETVLQGQGARELKER